MVAHSASRLGAAVVIAHVLVEGGIARPVRVALDPALGLEAVRRRPPANDVLRIDRVLIQSQIIWHVVSRCHCC